MTVLAFIVWIVAAYCLLVFLVGNPTERLIRRTPEPVLAEADACIAESTAPDDETIYHFLRQFLYAKLLLIVFALLELGVLVYFLIRSPLMPVVWVLLGKDVYLIWASRRWMTRQDEDGLFATLHEMPQWTRRWDRASHLASAVGFAYLFFRVVDGI